MASVYDEDIATAKELIALYGQDCLWHKPAPVIGGVPGYPEIGAEPDPIPCKLAFFSSRDVGRGGAGAFLAMLRGTEVPANKEVALLAGGIDFEPENTDHIDRGGVLVAIEQIDRLAPGGVPVLYYVTVSA